MRISPDAGSGAGRSRMTSGVRGLSSTMARMRYLRSCERNRSHECDGFEAHKERAANAHGNFKSKTTLADKLVGDDVRDSGRIQSRTFFTLALE
jgi:hypothetical protein